jgi:hypothetical protein
LVNKVRLVLNLEWAEKVRLEVTKSQFADRHVIVCEGDLGLTGDWAIGVRLGNDWRLTGEWE